MASLRQTYWQTNFLSFWDNHPRWGTPGSDPDDLAFWYNLPATESKDWKLPERYFKNKSLPSSKFFSFKIKRYYPPAIFQFSRKTVNIGQPFFSFPTTKKGIILQQFFIVMVMIHPDHIGIGIGRLSASAQGHLVCFKKYFRWLFLTLLSL